MSRARVRGAVVASAVAVVLAAFPVEGRTHMSTADPVGNYAVLWGTLSGGRSLVAYGVTHTGPGGFVEIRHADGSLDCWDWTNAYQHEPVVFASDGLTFARLMTDTACGSFTATWQASDAPSLSTTAGPPSVEYCSDWDPCGLSGHIEAANAGTPASARAVIDGEAVAVDRGAINGGVDFHRFELDPNW